MSHCTAIIDGLLGIPKILKVRWVLWSGLSRKMSCRPAKWRHRVYFSVWPVADIVITIQIHCFFIFLYLILICSEFQDSFKRSQRSFQLQICLLGRSPGPAVGSRASGGTSSCQAAGTEFDAARAKPSGEVRQETQRFVVASLQLGRLEHQWISGMYNPDRLAFDWQVLYQDLQMKELLALLGLANF